MEGTIHSQAKLIGSGESIVTKRSLTDKDDDPFSRSASPSSDDAIPLKKDLGLVSGVALIVGTMIGSGIFISPKGVLAGTGSVGLSFIVWVMCGLIALAGALAEAELGTMITKCGAEYAYIMGGLSSVNKFLADVVCFLFAWVSVFILKPALVGVIALSFALYTTEPFFKGCEPPDALVKIVAILCITVVAGFNCHSIRLASRIQNLFTVMKLIAIAMITVGGFIMLSQGETSVLAEGFEGTSNSPSLIALSFYDGLWAYDGWNNLNFVTEEIKNPYVNLPRAIIIAIPLVTVCYIFANISYLTVMTRAELLSSTAVAATWGERVLGTGAVIIPIAVAMSTFGAANGSCLTGGRLCYAAAREGHMPHILSYCHIRKQTPIPSIIFTSFVSIMMILPTDVFHLIDFFSFVAWIFYGLTMLSLLILRRTMPDIYRPYRCPLILPIFVMFFSVYLVIGPIIQNPQIEFFYAALFVLSGLVLYVPFIYFGVKVPGQDSFTRFVQITLECAPSRYLPPE